MPPSPLHPTVSVVIPAFNAESSIDAALKSVFAQSYRDLEVVVVDDGSTDGTASRLEAWRGRVRAVRQPNGGPGRARNVGILATSGPLIAFLDADDTWLPDKLEEQVAYFARFPHTGLLHTAVLSSRLASPYGPRADDGSDVSYSVSPPQVEDGTEVPCYERTAESIGAEGGPAAAAGHAEAPRAAFCEVFHTDVDVNTLTVMVPRKVLECVGLFDERREVHVEDWDLWLRIAAEYPVGYLARPTAVRGPGGLMSSAVEKTFDGQAHVIRRAAALCETACPAHRGAAAAACLRRRWHRFHWERGYARLRAGDSRGARASFLAALRHRPFHAGTWAQLGSAMAGATATEALRELRRAGRPRRAPDSRPVPPAFARSAEAPARSVPLVHDTWYRRTRHAAAERVHDLDDLVSKRGGRRRILFQAASPMSFVIFRPVYDRLRGDPRLEFWFTAVGSTWTPDALFDRVGIRDRVIPAADAAWMKVDACINTDFWDTAWLRRRTRRLHLFHGVAGKYGLDAPLDLAPIVAAYDRLFFPNGDRLERYVEAGLVWKGSPRGVLAGYPKVDRLVDGSLNVDAVASGLALDRRRPTVIYAPTWSPHSCLNRCGEAIVDRLASAGLNVVVKLHDRSYDLTPRGSGGIDWAARFARYRDHPGVRVVTDADSTPYLAVADAMVTDHSSVGFEYALLDRPIVIVDSPELIACARVTRSKVVELRSAAEVVPSDREVVAAVMRQLEAPGLHSEERRAIAGRYFYRPGTASARVAAVVYDVLGLPAPAPSPAATSGPKEALASVGR
jgi:GT2 family glycosyltransferase